MRTRPFLDCKAALAWLLHNTDAGIFLNEHIAEDGPVGFARTPAGLAPKGIASKRVGSTYRSGPCRGWIKVRNPASIAVQRGARCGTVRLRQRAPDEDRPVSEPMALGQ
jgi:hypothetical protein